LELIHKVGLWIDHRKALIVAITNKEEEIRLIISKVEKQLGRSNQQGCMEDRVGAGTV
jgi:hypothetical protein